MPTLLDRYLAGECLPVWNELARLGDGVRQKRYYADAAAVAAETMRRARHNVEVLITRLDEMGYRFLTMEQNEKNHGEGLRRFLPMRFSVEASLGGPKRIDVLSLSRSPELRAVIAAQADRAHDATLKYLNETVGRKNRPLEDSEVFNPPTKQTSADLDRLEELADGPLPLSLRAWYEQVGGVSLLGWHSALSPNADEPNGSIGPDPLMIEPLQMVTQTFEQVGFTGDMWVYLAPDEVLKAGEGGCGPYSMRVPSASADGIFGMQGDSQGPTFVEYLRNAFKWGGFPGWESRKERPQAILDRLAEGLLPL